MNFEEAKKQIRIWAEQASYRKQDLESQKKYLQNRLRENPDVGEAVMKDSCETLFFNNLYAARHSQKKTLNNNCIRFKDEQVPNRKQISTKDEAKFRKELKQTILDEYDCGGKRIGDCTQKEVYKEAEKHRRNGEGHIQQANIFTAVYKKMSGGKTVRECISPNTFINIVNRFKVISKIA